MALFSWPRSVYDFFLGRGIDPTCVQPTYDMSQIRPGAGGEDAAAATDTDMPYIQENSAFILYGTSNVAAPFYAEIGVLRPDGSTERVTHETALFPAFGATAEHFVAPEGHVLYAYLRGPAAEPKQSYGRLTVTRLPPGGIPDFNFNADLPEYLCLIDGYTAQADGKGARFPHGKERGARTNETGYIHEYFTFDSGGFFIDFAGVVNNRITRIQIARFQWETDATPGDRRLALNVAGNLFASPVVQPPSTQYLYVFAVGIPEPYAVDYDAPNYSRIVHIPIPDIRLFGQQDVQAEARPAVETDGFFDAALRVEEWAVLEEVNG